MPSSILITPSTTIRLSQSIEIITRPILPRVPIKQNIRDEAEPVFLSCCSISRFIDGGLWSANAALPTAIDPRNSMGCNPPKRMVRIPLTILNAKLPVIIISGFIN